MTPWELKFLTEAELAEAHKRSEVAVRVILRLEHAGRIERSVLENYEAELAVIQAEIERRATRQREPGVRYGYRVVPLH